MKILSLHSVCLFFYLNHSNENAHCHLGTIVALLDLLFVFFLVPESLPERLRTDHKISWNTIDPFAVCLLVDFRSK